MLPNRMSAVAVGKTALLRWFAEGFVEIALVSKSCPSKFFLFRKLLSFPVPWVLLLCVLGLLRAIGLVIVPLVNCIINLHLIIAVNFFCGTYVKTIAYSHIAQRSSSSRSNLGLLNCVLHFAKNV